MAGLVVVRTRTGSVRPIPAGSIRVNQVRRRTAGISGRAGELQPGAGLSFGKVLKVGGAALGGFLTGGPAGALAAGAAAAGLTGGGGGAPSAPTGSPPPLGSASGFAPSACPEGFRVNPQTGVCERTGIGGVLQRVIPGGATGTLAPTEGGGLIGPVGPGGSGEVVLGAFGVPAMRPTQVGSITRADGSMAPILRCRAGMVLGRDDLCYVTSVIGVRGKFRKHRPNPKPPITGGDQAAIRRAASAVGRVQRLAKSVGLQMHKKPARATSKRKR